MIILLVFLCITAYWAWLLWEPAKVTPDCFEDFIVQLVKAIVVATALVGAADEPAVLGIGTLFSLLAFCSCMVIGVILSELLKSSKVKAAEQSLKSAVKAWLDR